MFHDLVNLSVKLFWSESCSNVKVLVLHTFQSELRVIKCPLHNKTSCYSHMTCTAVRTPQEPVDCKRSRHLAFVWNSAMGVICFFYSAPNTVRKWHNLINLPQFPILYTSMSFIQCVRIHKTEVHACVVALYTGLWYGCTCVFKAAV